MKEPRYTAEQYQVMCRILVVILIIVLFWWWRSENARIKRIEELKLRIDQYEEQLYELKSSEDY